MNHRTSILCRRSLRAYAAAFISYLMLAGQLAPLALGAAAPRAASAARPEPVAEAVVNSAAPVAPPAPSALPAPAAILLAPGITATKVDSFPDPNSNGKAEPGDTITYTVTISNAGPDAATGVQFSDAGDLNTSLVPGSVQTQPIAMADTATAFGNVRISTTNGAPNLLTNDFDPDTSGSSGLTASGPTTGPTNGQATVSANGDFTYNPNPGFTGSDSFTYTVTDANGKTDTATMTITVGPTLIWFINNTAAGGGDGRITSPFNSIAAFNAGAADDPGDIIFIYNGTGTYTGGITLLNTQKLIGQGFSLATETGAPPAGSDALPAAGSTPTIDNAGSNIITVGQNNTLRGFNTGNSGAAGTDISGTSFGTLTVSNLSINGDGRALNLTTGTLAAAVANILASNTGTNAGLVLNGVGGSLTVSTNTTMTNPGGNGIDVTNAPAGTSLNFGTANISKNAAGACVNLATNLGTTAFTSLTVSNSSGAGITINNAGTVNATTGSITTTGTGVAASFTNTTLGLTFTTVSSNGGANGLIFSGGTGSFTTGTTTLQNNAGIGLLMSSSAVAASFGNTGVSSSAGDAVDLSSNTGTITFADLDMSPDAGLRGLDAQNNTQAITVTSGDITTSGGGTASAVFVDGPAGRTPINLTFTSVTTAGVGSGSASISLVDVSGTKFQVTGTTQINTRSGRGVFVDNSTAPTIQFATTNIPNPSNAGGNGFHVEDSSSAVTVATATISDANVTVAQGDGGNGTPSSVGDGDAIFLNNNTGAFTLSGGTLSNCGNDCIDIRTTSGGITVSGVTISTPGLDVTGATGSGAGGHGISAVNMTGTNSFTGTTISNVNVANRDGFHYYNSTGTANTTIQGVTFQNYNGNAGITADTSGTANNTITVGATASNVATNCTFSNISASAINFATSGTATLNATVQRSTFQNADNDEKTNLTAGHIQGSHVTYNIINNTFNDVGQTASTGEGLISISADATLAGNTFAANVSGNTISNVGNATTGCGGGVTLCLGPLNTILIFIDDQANVPGTIHVDNNIVTATQQGGMLLDIHNTGANAGTIVNARITGNTFGTDASRVGSNAGATTHYGIRVERRANNAPPANVLINGNSIRNGPGSVSTLNGPGIHARTKANDNMSVTITSNNIDTLGAGVAEIRVDTNANDAGDITTPTQCSDITGNTLPAGAAAAIDINEVNGTHNVEQASAAAVAAANSGATVTADAGVTFGVACATPPTGPVSGGGGDAFTGAVMVGAPGIVSDDAAQSKSAFGGVTDRPFIGLPRTAPKAPAAATVAPRTAPARKPADASANNAAGQTTERTSPITTRDGGIKKKLNTPVLSDDPGTPNGTGVGITNFNIGTLPAGDSVTITFQVTVDNPYTGGPNVSNQGSVSGSNFSTVLTDDPAVGGASDPTLTPINSIDIRINNAKLAEPASPNTADMAFTVSLSQPAGGPVSVNFVTANDTATAGTCGNPGADYVTTNGTVNFVAGEQVKTINVPICSDSDVEGDETFFVNLSGAVGGTVVDAQGVGTITLNTPGTFIISELRTSGPGGTNDDFVEFYNNSNSPLTVAASDASAGYGLFKMGADCNATPVLLGVIPNGTVIPARGHYLMVGSAYSLTNYGGSGAAAGNLTMTSDIGNDQNVGVFTTSDIINVATANRLDAVGFGTNVGGACNLLREPSNLPAVSGSTTEHSFFRKQCDFVPGGPGCTAGGNPKDTNDNSADFMFADTQGTFISGVTQRLGAPGPENISSPIRRDTSGISAVLLDGSKPSSAEPNRHRDLTSNPGANSTFGTLSIRRHVVNQTGGNVTRLRFRIVEMTTFPSPGGGQADLRAITSSSVSVMAINDPNTCSPAATPCTLTVQGTTLEQPPSQPNGGGVNSTLSAGTITLGTPLANNASINLQFLLGIQQPGTFRFYIIVEALP